MASMPLCFRFSRLVLDNSINACHLRKIGHPSIRISSSAGLQMWSNSTVSKSTPPARGQRDPLRNFRQFMNFTAPEGKNAMKDDKNETVSGEKGVGKNESEQGNAIEADLKKHIDFLTQEVENLNKQNNELMDKYRRALAEIENTRKRYMKQADDAKKFGIQGFCKDILEVADTLSIATEAVPKEQLTDSNPHLKNLYEGLAMTEAELKKVFLKNGLVTVNPINETFDPNYHEALFQQEVKGQAPGTIVVVSKVGYKLHDRVIRPAIVGVAKG